MNKPTLLATLMMIGLVGMAGTARAGGSPGSIGIGAEFTLASFNVGMGGGSFGLGGASLNYDAGDFHVGGALGFADDDGPDNTVFSLGGRFYYHLHSTAMADFGLGGNIGLLSIDTGADRASLMYLEPGFQIRAFITPNVAFSFTAGIAIGLVDAEGLLLSGQVNGVGGIHYYFF